MKPTYLFSGIAAASLIFGGPFAVERDLVALERAQTRAWATNARGELSAVHAQLESYVAAHAAEARGHYLLGLAEVQGVIQTNGSADQRRKDEGAAALARARAHLERALELDAGAADVHATLAFCALQRLILGRAEPAEGGLMMGWLQQGQSADAERVSVRLMSIWLGVSRSIGDAEQAELWLGRFIELGESILATLEAGEREPEFWDLFGLALVGRALIFAPQPRPRVAAMLTAAALEIMPDFHMARAFLLPFVTPHEPLAREQWRELAWTEHGVEVNSDGSQPGLADAVAVASAIVDRDGAAQLWVRATLAEAPNTALFGINLIVDSDGNQESGAAWWGGNTAFTFDRLVSACVALDDEGTYRGAVGITDADGAYPGEMTNLGDGNVGFGIDEAAPALLLRIPLEALGDPARLRFVVAVGSNSQWNDNLPDEGSFGLER